MHFWWCGCVGSGSLGHFLVWLAVAHFPVRYTIELYEILDPAPRRHWIFTKSLILFSLGDLFLFFDFVNKTLPVVAMVDGVLMF